MKPFTITFDAVTVGWLLFGVLMFAYWVLSSLLRDDLTRYQNQLVAKEEEHNRQGQNQKRSMFARIIDVFVPPNIPATTRQPVPKPNHRIPTLIGCQLISKTLLAMVTPFACITLGIKIPSNIAASLSPLFPSYFLPSLALAALFGYGALVHTWKRLIRLNLGNLFEPVDENYG